MVNNSTYSFPTHTTEQDIRSAFNLLSNVHAVDDDQVKFAQYICNCLPNGRLELFRHIINNASFETYAEFFPILLDIAVRLRVFDGRKPPKVNLFCVGSARCGTTTLSLMLSQNTDIYIPPIKEPNFFSHTSAIASPKGVPLEVYELYFAGWTGQKVIGDFSPVYILHEHAIRTIKSYNPASKIIICLRNPVDRAISAYRYTKPFHNCASAATYFKEAVAANKRDIDPTKPWFSAQALLRQGLYFDDLKAVFSLFKDVLLVEFAEFNDLSKLNSRVCTFLGVREQSISWTTSFDGKINSSERLDNNDHADAQDILNKYYENDIDKTRVAYGITLCSEG